VLDTERLTLRELTQDDAEFIVAQLNDPDFIRNVADRGVRTIEAARAYIRDGPVASYRRHGFGLLLVELKDSRVPIGICGLIKRETLDDVDIGFALLPPFRSQGFALEAAKATLRLARALGLSRIVAIVSPHNADSMGLLSKLGFRHERRIRLGDAEEELELFAATLEIGTDFPRYNNRNGTAEVS
jgi:ribosomal-protein-alanine N-acetyltransferase